ncbi:MAG: hypothetical protein RI883_592 [Bacteroidota bacterium]|jgi:hypothetical protein
MGGTTKFKRNFMINYEKKSSPFYIENKEYCESIERKATILKAEVNGYCNSYGYEIDVQYSIKMLSIQLKLLKAQTTRGGSMIALDASNNQSIEIKISGLETWINLNAGQNKLKRFFSSKKIRILFPSPFYCSINSEMNDESIDLFISLLLNHNVTSLEIKNGKGNIKIHPATLSIDPFEFVNVLEKQLLILSK